MGVFTCSDWVGPAISAAPDVESNSTGRSKDGVVDVGVGGPAGVGGVGGWEGGD